jgi:EAL domain-containing protein (putative c-di-GMP-specific phosphodiesterase class I)/ActR/RegA family two-component response regulator
LLVLDSRMPRLDGAGVIDALRADEATQRLAIIIVTEVSEMDARIRGLDSGADDYLAKPVDVDELVARVRTQLRSESAWRDVQRREFAERTRILGDIAAIPSLAVAGETAMLITARLLEIQGCAFAAILEFRPDGPIVPLALGMRSMPVRRERGTLPDGYEFLRAKAASGPWVEDLCAPGREVLHRALRVDEAAAAPIRHGTAVVGLLVLGIDPVAARNPREETRARILSAAGDSARLVGAIIGPALERSEEASTGRARLAHVLAHRAFGVVFQPLVKLSDRSVIGYEGLTRFADGARPDLRFAEAARSGLGREYELAAVEVQLEVARALPPQAWLTVNVSPDLVIEGGRLAALLHGVSRKVVLELTEHVAIEDYRAARAAIDRIRPLADVAIDDAGAGFASLRHILELRPNLVKLDASLTRGIETDPLRQALIAGLVHFAGTAGFALLGEAIETEPEAVTLSALGVEYGQGYLFGRPAPIDRWAIHDTAVRSLVPAGA